MKLRPSRNFYNIHFAIIVKLFVTLLTNITQPLWRENKILHPVDVEFVFEWFFLPVWSIGKSYSARRLMGLRITKSAVSCNQILLSQLHITVHKTRQLIEWFGYCYRFYVGPKWSYQTADIVYVKKNFNISPYILLEEKKNYVNKPRFNRKIHESLLNLAQS